VYKNGGTKTFQDYNWVIEWGDGSSETARGTGAENKLISHTYTDGKGTHTIKIRGEGQGWFNAFGTGNGTATYGNSAKIKELLTPVSDVMRTMANYAFFYMFAYCTGITELPPWLLPAKEIATEGYYRVFLGCTGLTALPSGFFPATKLGNYAYDGIFKDCTNLASVPSDLLQAATDPYNNSYYNMFANCGLTSIPALPAAPLKPGICYAMFSGCKSLVSIPRGYFPSDTALPQQCYELMFNGCTNLEDIGDINAAWFSARSPAQSRMFKDCSKINKPMSYSAIPSGWKNS
jgi:hypothetical protein